MMDWWRASVNQIIHRPVHMLWKLLCINCENTLTLCIVDVDKQ
jgi:hypothetical protein